MITFNSSYPFAARRHVVLLDVNSLSLSNHLAFFLKRWRIGNVLMFTILFLDFKIKNY
jgi:hypothetical protein